MSGLIRSSMMAGSGRRTGSIWDIPMYNTTAPQISAIISRRLLMVWVSATLISSGSARLPEKPVLLTISTSICSLTEGSHRTVALLVARLTLTGSTRRRAAARSTEAEQAAQVIPLMSILTCLV